MEYFFSCHIGRLIATGIKILVKTYLCTIFRHASRKEFELEIRTTFSFKCHNLSETNFFQRLN